MINIFPLPHVRLAIHVEPERIYVICQPLEGRPPHEIDARKRADSRRCACLIGQCTTFGSVGGVFV